MLDVANVHEVSGSRGEPLLFRNFRASHVVLRASCCCFCLKTNEIDIESLAPCVHHAYREGQR